MFEKPICIGHILAIAIPKKLPIPINRYISSKVTSVVSRKQYRVRLANVNNFFRKETDLIYHVVETMLYYKFLD